MKRDAPVIAGLAGKRATISTEIAELEARLAWLRDSLASVEATMRVFQPGTNPDAIDPQVKSNAYRMFRIGYLSRLVLDTLRRRGPLDKEAITLAVMYDAGLDVGDGLLRSNVRRRVYYTLRDQTRSGRLERDGERWRIAPN